MTEFMRAGEMRRTETPNAVMTTLASPTQGTTAELSVWRISMRPGQQGPVHSFDREQVWHLLDGEVQFTVAGETHRLGTGDVIVLAAGTERQVTARTTTEIIACGASGSSVTAAGDRAPRGVPPWIA